MARVARLSRPAAKQRRWCRTQQRTLAFYLFIAPWLIGFVVLGVLPLAIGLLISFTNYDGLNLANVRFIGLGNYARVVSDPDTGYALSRTLIWSALNVPIWLLFSLSLALLLNRSGRAQGLFRTLFYLPSIIPLVATVWIWRIFLDANSGLLNGLISLFRPGTAVQWFADYGLVSLTAISVWAGLGSGMVIFLAGLQGIPSELEEAARIDGASGWDVLRYITLPLLTPVIFFQLVLALISSFQQIVVPLMWAGPSATVPRSVYLYMVHTYQQIFAYQRFGYGIALVWLLLLVIAALTLLVFRSARYWVHYEEGGEGNSA